MASMSYCKFENTLVDLRQCLTALKEGEKIGSYHEEEAFKSMFEEFVEFLLDEDIIGHKNDMDIPVWDALDEYLDDAIAENEEEDS